MTLRCSCGSIQLSVNATPDSLVSMQHLSSDALAKGTADLEFVAKFGELWGNPRKYKSHTSPGRKFALLEGLSHDLKSVPDRFIMSILRGRCGTVNYHPVFKFNKLKSFSGVEI